MQPPVFYETPIMINACAAPYMQSSSIAVVPNSICSESSIVNNDELN